MLRTLGNVGVAGHEFGRPKPLLLLAYLTLEGPQSRRHLAELFWPGSDQGRRSLTTALARLRKAVHGSIGANDSQVWSELDCDVIELQRALEEGELGRALRLYEGPFLGNLDLDELPVELEEWLYEKRESIASRLQKALLEEALRHWARGDGAGAARTAARGCRLAGAGPAPPLVASKLHALLLAADHPLATEVARELGEYGLTLPASSAEAREQLQNLSLEATPHRLPHRGGAFIGREVELAELSLALNRGDRRLITLVGPGGMGKTRLSIEVARRALLAGAFPDGVYFVGLEALREAEEVPGAIADVFELELADADGALARLSALLRRKRTLLVLDNVEQLPGVQEPIAGLLEECEQLTLIVTSRHRLGLSGEWVVPLSGLSFPDRQLDQGEAALFDAPRLFEQRVRQTGVRLNLEKDLVDVLRLCRLLEGAPLGLELAAAWAPLLSVDEIADEVENSFDLLTSSGDSARQSSLRAVFEHSWTLLSTDEQAALRRLSLARGGFTRDLAHELALCDARTLLSLAGKSLIERVGNGRFRLLEVTREYAFEQLTRSADLRGAWQRFMAHFLRLAEDAEEGLRGDRQVESLERLSAERDNLRAALHYSLESGNVEPGMRIAAALQMFWWIRGEYREGLARIESLLAAARPEVEASARAKALHRAGTLAHELGEYIRARAHYEEALAIAERANLQQIRADALHSLGLLASKRGEVAIAAELYEQCLQLQRQLGDRWGSSATLNNMGVNLLSGGHFERARQPLLESLELKRAMGEKQGIAYALHNLGTAALALGELDAAQEYVEASLELKRALGDEQALCTSYTALGRIALRRGQYDRARQKLLAGLWQLAKLENRWTFTTELAALVSLEASCGKPEKALRLSGFIESSCRDLNMRLPRLAAIEMQEGRRKAMTEIDAAAAERLLAQGRSLDLAGAAVHVASEADRLPAGKID
ncbi:MAG TPA: tetratricopeptide repeat protein [Trueperaceae bacterium]